MLMAEKKNPGSVSKIMGFSWQLSHGNESMRLLHAILWKLDVN